jgi:hypothetical protein
MAQSILVFDFGANEQAAQQARHKVEAWKQGFRLGNKMLLKFEREQTADQNPAPAAEEEGSDAPAKHASDPAKSGKKKAAKAGARSKGSAKSAAQAEEPDSAVSPNGHVRVLVRLDFSDHEKLSHQRWLDRIPSEEPFKSAAGQTIRTGDPEFAKTAELFESLD